MKKPAIMITHTTGQYPVYLGSHLLGNEALLSRLTEHSRIFIVTDKNVAPIYLNTLTQSLKSNQYDVLILSPGESEKTLTTFEHIIDTLITSKHHRDTTLIALGGGVIGDITGFAAACYLRGVKCIQIPTTLLAQVDAAIGGKTAVNHPAGKNLIGAFHQPSAVIIDVETLDTLPDREFRAGIAEIIKVALIHDASFFSWLENNMQGILCRKSPALLYAIQRACEIKAHYVSCDERESYFRMHLNLGHTFGHAIEQCLNFKEWLHGEAVAYGLIMAAYISHSAHKLSSDDFSRVFNLLKENNLVKKLPETLTNTALVDAMQQDKKIKSGKHQLILLSRIGESFISGDIPTGMIQSSWIKVSKLI